MSVPVNENSQIMRVDGTFSDGSALVSLPAAPATHLVSSNPLVEVGIGDAGAREIWAKRLAPGPLDAVVTTTVTTAAGTLSVDHSVSFDGVPPVTFATLTVVDIRTGNR